jgi:methionyl-tRNA formyltransferase
MSNVPPTDRWNVLFFGMPCAFSSPILASLDRPDVRLVGVVSPLRGNADVPFRVMKGLKTPRSLPVGAVRRTLHAPRWLARDIKDPQLAESLANLQPDLIVVACYPQLLPASITSLARIAAINIHPSLLPRHRGPDPLFWAFRCGDTTAGVTVHLLSEQFDTGDILAQRATAIAPGESLSALEQRLASIGALEVGALITVLPTFPLPEPQDAALAGSESWPTERDLVIDPAWTVARARDFVAGVARSHGPLLYEEPQGAVIRVTGLGAGGRGHEIACADGVLSVLAT